MPYADTDDVIAALGGVTIDDDSNPSEADVTARLADAEAEVNAELRAAGFTVPVTDEDGLDVLKARVASHVAAYVARAHGASRNDPEMVKLGNDLDSLWTEFIAKIAKRPAAVAEMIGQTILGSSGRGHARSHVTDRTTDATDEDLDPKLTTDMEN